MFNVHGERVALVTDTSCDLSDEQLARYDISMVSLRVNSGIGWRSTRKKCMNY